MNKKIKPNKNKQKIGTAWFTILLVYFILFIGTGYLTFFYNNNFGLNQERINLIQKIEERNSDIDTSKSNTIKKIIKADMASYNEINGIASQAFNVVLGAILSFLTTTITTQLNIRKNK